MDAKYLKYLVESLRNYRHVSYGQFDQETRYEVPVTQDAATAINDLLELNKSLQDKLDFLSNKTTMANNLISISFTTKKNCFGFYEAIESAMENK